jgi:hypothetical protein
MCNLFNEKVDLQIVPFVKYMIAFLQVKHEFTLQVISFMKYKSQDLSLY